jgi:hypothetical protein
VRAAALIFPLASALLGCRPSTDSDARRCDLLAGRRPTVMTFTNHGERITDGVSARPGAPWASALTSVISAGGGVEWDLGRIEPLARAWLEADNNDGYALSASTDRRHWTTVWEAPPVDAFGLQARSSDSLTGEARYLRLEPRGGDAFYSVAELVVAQPGCSGPWPPRLAERPGDTTELPGEPPLGPSIALAAALGAAALFWAWLSRHKQRMPSWRDPLVVTGTAIGIFVVATALSYAVGHRFNVADDAYISFVYAKNWISGLGLVFNPGERVEGYTNFLWVALLAPLWPLSAHNPAVMTRLATFLAIGFAVLTLLLLALIARRVFPRVRLAAVLAMLMVAFDDSFVSYTTVFALENHLLMALMLAGLALVLYRPRHWDLALGVSFALAGMTRPDAVLWPLAFFAVYGPALAARRAPDDDDRLSGGSLVRAGAVFATLFGAYFVWRAWYFGELLPNTFYLKTGATLAALHRGFAYLRSYAEQRLWVPMIAFAALVFSRSAWSRWLVVHTALHAAYVAYVGGDFYAGQRFLLVLAPNIALLVALVLVRASEMLRGRAAWVVPAAALAACLAVRWGTLRYGPYTADLHGFGSYVDNNVKYMQWLKDVARPDATMVVGDIGATGLFTDVRAIDVFGVVDRTVAHKQVGGFGTGRAGHEKLLTREEQLARNPTYIKWGYVDDWRRPPGYYIFNDFPRHLRVEGLWVKDDLAVGHTIEAATWHLDQAELGRWQRSGPAFAAAPSLQAARDQKPINGANGTFINTFTDAEGDGATGRLLSPPFELVGDRMRLLVGGGRDPERLRVSLLVGDRRVFSETGGDWETLGRREWDIAPLRGQTARIEIVDEATGAWGHLLVDEIEQWSGTPDRSGKI